MRQVGPAGRFLGRGRRLWLGDSDVDRNLRRLARYAAVAVLAVFALGLGTWGFALSHLGQAAWNWNDVYRALQLFPLHSGDVEHVPWQLQIARFSAPAVDAVAVLGAISILAGGLRTRARLLRFSDHVIVCGGGVHGGRLTKNISQATDVVLVDPDRRAPRFQEPANRHELRLVLHAVHRDALRQAGVGKAARLIAVTGDDFTNSQIVSTVRALAMEDGLRGGLEVFVQVEDPFLARFLEEGEPRRAQPQGQGNPAPAVNVFSGNAIAAGALFGEGRAAPADQGTATLSAVERSQRPHLLLAGDHPLLEAVVLAELRRLRARREAQPPGQPKGPPFRFTFIGPRAVDRVERLMQRWLPEPELMEFEPRDTNQDDEQSILADRWFRDRHRPDHAVVACEQELDGIGLTLAISHALGSRVPVTRVTTQPRSELDRQLQDHARRTGQLPSITVVSIADLAWGEDHRAIEQLPMRERLVDALRTEVGVPEAEARARAKELLERGGVRVRFDAAPRVTPGTRGLVTALLQAASTESGQAEQVPLSALVGAGLMVDLHSHRNLRRAAERLSTNGHGQTAFAAWSEYIRHVPDTVALDPGRVPKGGLGADIVGLRAAALGGLDRLNGLQPDPAVCRDASRIALVLGGGDRMSAEARGRLQALLERALLDFNGLILTGGRNLDLASAVRAAASGNPARVVVYAAAGQVEPGRGQRVTRADGADEFPSVQMWADILAAEFPTREVRLVAVAGRDGVTPEILLGRALGAEVVWLDPASESPAPLEDELPGGTDGVLEMVNDPMTLRAFLVWPPMETLGDDLRERVAMYLHQAYRGKHRQEKPADDPALAPWERLIPTLQRSNRAAAEDIPNKLAVIGKRVQPSGQRLTLSPDQVELLAEMEHGRFNYERLSGGWRLGQRHIIRMVSPYLRPWDELEEQQKQRDRDSVLNIDPALERANYGVADLVESVQR